MKKSSTFRYGTFLRAGIFLYSALLLSGCGGGGVGNIAAHDGSVQISDDAGVDGMPSLQAMLAAEPEDDALTARSASSTGSSSAEASSSYPGRVAADAFDGDDATFWTGSVATSTWTLSYTLPGEAYIGQVSILFHSNNYVPTSTTLHISSDGQNWTEIGTVNAPDFNPSFTFPNEYISYIRINMEGKPFKGAPSIREIDWVDPIYNTGISATPNLNSSKYFPSLLVDGDESTYWAGTPNAGDWNIYYCFPAPRHVELVTIKYRALSYIPGAVEISAWDDSLGGWQPSMNGYASAGLTSYGYLGLTTSCINIRMNGNPIRLFPVVSEIYFDIQPGPASTDSINKNYTAPLAGDGNMATWWTGTEGNWNWTMYYGLSEIETVNGVTIHWTSNRTVPTTTELYYSGDGENWQYLEDFPYAVDATLSPSVNAKYLKFAMSGTPPFGKPAIREIDVSSAPTSPAATISLGNEFTCMTDESGGAKCWGRNGSGQLGIGTTNGDYSTPMAVSGITNAVSIAAGASMMGWPHACAALATGNVMCWGNNMVDVLVQDIMIDNIPSPISISGVSDAVEVAASDLSTCYLQSGGGIKCWGNGGQGVLGNGSTSNSETPVSVIGIDNAISISGGDHHYCALLSTGEVKCWGENSQGELGNGTNTRSSTPVSVSGVSNAIYISTGALFSCAVLSDGSIKCWGYNSYGQLGAQMTSSYEMTPVSVVGITNAVQVAAGESHTCAALVDGSVKCWGGNDFGQLGDGTTDSSLVPVTVPGISSATAISVSSLSSCALTSEGGIKCWGDNWFGQLGVGTVGNRYYLPVSVIGY